MLIIGLLDNKISFLSFSKYVMSNPDNGTLKAPTTRHPICQRLTYLEKLKNEILLSKRPIMSILYFIKNFDLLVKIFTLLSKIYKL